MKRPSANRVAATYRQGGVYRLLSQADAETRAILDGPTPAWLDREYPYVAAPGERETLGELSYLVSLVPMREEHRAFVVEADEDMYGLFWRLCEELGVRLSPGTRSRIEERRSDAEKVIQKLKWLYNRPRPYQIAAKHGVDFAPMGSKTAHTPAYPSGHTIQANLTASLLSEIAPQHRRAFMALAHEISFSRLVGGYHWPSDIAFGKAIFRHMVNPLMPSSVRVAAKYKSKREVPKADGSGTTTVYEYGPRQQAESNRQKARRVEHLRGQLADLRKKARGDLDSNDPTTRLTALAVCLMDETYERVGNEKSAKNGHHGVTNWTADHVTLSDKAATIRYTGKSGVKQEKKVTLPKVVKALRQALKGKGKGDKILCDGDECSILAKDVNAYLKPYGITAKDIRGLHANEEMRRALKEVRAGGPDLPRLRKERDPILKKELKEALAIAAAAVGHEPSTLKGQYLVPGLVDAYLKDGTVIDKLDKKATLSQTEREDREAERLVKKSPKKKPPRRDLERRRVDTEDRDPDDKQDEKDRSNRDRDASGYRVALRYLLAENSDDLISVREVESGKVVKVKPETLQNEPNKYEELEEGEGEDGEGEGEDAPPEKEEPEVKTVSDALTELMGEDNRQQAKEDLTKAVLSDLGSLVDSPEAVDSQLAEDIKAAVEALSNDDLEAMKTMAFEEAGVGENENPTAEQQGPIMETFQKLLKEELQPAVEEANRAAGERREEAEGEYVSNSLKGATTEMDGDQAGELESYVEGLEGHEAKKKFFQDLEAKAQGLMEDPPEDLQKFVKEVQELKDWLGGSGSTGEDAKDFMRESSPKDLAEAYAKISFYENLVNSPFADAKNGELPRKDEPDPGAGLKDLSDLTGDELEQAKKDNAEAQKAVEKAKKKALDRAEASFDKYLTLDSDDRKKNLDRVEREIKKLSKEGLSETHPRRLEAEAVKRGLIMAGAIQDGDKAKGMGASMAQLARAAQKAGNVRDVLAIGGIGGTGPIEGTDQDALRTAFDKLEPEDLLEVLGDDHPAADYLKIITDPEEGKYANPADFDEIREEVVDLLVSETAFLDPALLKIMGGDPNVGEQSEAKKKLRQERLGEKPPPPPAPTSGVAKVKGWFTEMVQSLLGKDGGGSGSGGSGSGGGKKERGPGDVWSENGKWNAKSPDGKTKSWDLAEEGAKEKAQNWAQGTRREGSMDWDFRPWGKLNPSHR